MVGSVVDQVAVVERLFGSWGTFYINGLCLSRGGRCSGAIITVNVTSVRRDPKVAFVEMWPLMEVRLYVKAGVNVKAVLTSLNMAFLPYLGHVIPLLIQLINHCLAIFGHFGKEIFF